MSRIGIIGSAGRGGDEEKLNDKVYSSILSYLEDKLPNDCTLVSGGSSWMDHLAVSLYLKYQDKFKLELYIPCEWDTTNRCYRDNGVVDWMVNPGGTLNYYHRRFSKIVGFDSLDQINDAISRGAILKVEKGLFKRNDRVASSIDVLYAFTFTTRDSPCDGGTLYTWKKAKCKKVNCISIPIYDFLK